MRAYLKIYDGWETTKKCGLIEVELKRIDGIVYWVFAHGQSWFSDTYEEIDEKASERLQAIPILSKILAREKPVWFLSDLRVPYEEYPL